MFNEFIASGKEYAKDLDTLVSAFMTPLENSSFFVVFHGIDGVILLALKISLLFFKMALILREGEALKCYVCILSACCDGRQYINSCLSSLSLILYVLV